MDKHITGMSMNVSPGTVVVNGKPVEARSAALTIGIDKYGQWRLSSVEASLSWWRRRLVALAYWHPPKPKAVEPEPTTYEDEWD